MTSVRKILVVAIVFLAVPFASAFQSGRRSFIRKPFSAAPNATGEGRFPGTSKRSSRTEGAFDFVPPQVDVAGANPGSTVERGNCLTLGLAAGVATECGDLRIVHQLPATRTFGRLRTPTLIYSTAEASPYPLVAANVTLPSGTTGLNRVEATLFVEGVARAHGSWSAASWPSSATTRIALGYDASSEPTAIYRYRLDVSAYYGTTPLTTQVRGEVSIVNRRSSPFGRGWWLAGIENLVLDPQGNPAMWVGGDGSTRRYVRDPNNTNLWHAPSMDRPEQLAKEGNGFVRLVAGGIRVIFDSVGRHIKTINRLNQETTFAYDSVGRLASIAIPPADTIVPPRCEPQVGGGTICFGPGLAFKTYSLHYDASGYITSIDAPSVGFSRTTKIKVANSQLVSITAPDSGTWQFSYPSPGSGRVTLETSPRGRATEFGYDPAWKVSSMRIRLPDGDSVTTQLQAAEAIGLPRANGSGATDTSIVYTTLDGPRRDSADVTLFWIDRFGSPRRIRNALSDETTLARNNAQFPGLVTDLVSPNGLYTRADYDPNGNPTRVISFNPLADGQNDTTRYEWDARWNEVTKIVMPEHDSSLFAYDTLNGNRLFQQPGSDPARRTVFHYGANGLLSMAVPPGQTSSDSVIYDKNANFSGVLFFVPRLSIWAVKRLTGSDNFGRVVSHRFATNFGYQTDSIVYDAADRVTRTIAIAPDSARPQDTAYVYVDNVYDREGNVLSVSRRTTPDTAHVQTITTSFAYDLLNRKISEIAPDGQADATIYDAAGNDTAYISRRRNLNGDRLRISTTYDRLNRVATRIIPQVDYAKDSTGIPTHQGPGYKEPYPYYHNTSGGLTIDPDTTRFTYDVSGGIKRATNGSADVWRAYYPNGMIMTDTTQIRTTAGTLSGHLFGIGYTYDRNGRRLRLNHPVELAPAGSSPTQYAYDPVTGMLSNVTDPLGMRFDFHYSARGELDTLTRHNTIVEHHGYDSEGLVIADSVFNRSQAPRAYSEPILRAARFLYDLRDKLVRTDNSLGPRDTLTAAYNGFGQLTSGFSNSHGNSIYKNRAVSFSTEDITQDGLGNQVKRVESLLYTEIGSMDGGSQSWSAVPTQFQYETGTGRLLTTAGRISYSIRYDSAGNEVFRSEQPLRSDRASYYGADDRLRVADSRRWTTTSFMRTFEEYRYDALGRRVWVRTRRACDGSELDLPEPRGYCNLSTIRRTIWDGDTELYEIQAPGGDTSPYLESDAPIPQLAVDSSGQKYFDPNAYYGSVGYTYGVDIDQPLVIIRSGYSEFLDVDGVPHAYTQFAPYSVSPLWNERGQATDGFFKDGAPLNCANDRHCAKLLWPGGWFAYARQNFIAPSWHGTLITDKRDQAGTHFHRNRVYDPETGRFTQEDPIGVAGGVNLYGFAGADPVNFSDPFGLCKPWPECMLQAAADWGAARGGALGEVVTNAAALGNGASEAFGVNDLGAAVGKGSVGGTIVGLAGVLPIGRISRVGKALPALDRTGKIHGALPAVEDLARHSLDDLAHFQQELQKSVQQRIRRTIELGPDPAHGQRQAAEQQLIRQIEKLLRDP